MIITIDGPAAVGKSSTGKAVAERTGFLHVDTGLLYRVLAYVARENGYAGHRGDWQALASVDLVELAIRWQSKDSELQPDFTDVTWASAIREPDITAGASFLAQVPAGRDWVLAEVISVAAHQNLIVSGRDAGTAMFPNAPLKFYLVAESRTRAIRRLLQRGFSDPTPTQIAREVQLIEERDRLDHERPIAPLCIPLGAVVIDTTVVSFEEQVHTVLDQMAAIQHTI